MHFMIVMIFDGEDSNSKSNIFRSVIKSHYCNVLNRLWLWIIYFGNGEIRNAEMIGQKWERHLVIQDMNDI